ncbi:Predicted dehydrogenase [Parapedobacter indicus]|uniref:Predicted dehydrogenase n=2 Tax=Parapedobacter indicus TaxID=1477437 RepID=A0A1I3RZ66_9SPHI|nr:Gfo/Idh/MocA family oxidoreductase [Parapedobacter indicus]PPK99918.1 putative dehydrogenase [Parapedobacter indicus]SFJ51873.1 Predicted dehydrogenase [Parapedobacter indicus]
MDLSRIAYQIPKPALHTPIVCIGAGNIVQQAHLPAYALAGFEVTGITDLNSELARKVADDFAIPSVYDSLDEACRQHGNAVIFDVAVPGNAILGILERLPANTYVLLQKPMGENIADAQRILDICRKKNITAAMNFQLRYAPYMMMAKEMRRQGVLGEVCDIEVHVDAYTPWHLWDFLREAPRVEIVYHSIHYIDLIRHLIGTPRGVLGKTVKHPLMADLDSVRSAIILDYGDMLRANILTNHAHRYGAAYENAYVKIEGTLGAVRIQLGLIMNYPDGVEDKFEYALLGEDGSRTGWKSLPINGSWFPHAFIGSMAEVMEARHTGKQPDNSVEDGFETMLCVEAAYRTVIPPLAGFMP